jgi:hypothetical protein
MPLLMAVSTATQEAAVRAGRAPGEAAETIGMLEETTAIAVEAALRNRGFEPVAPPSLPRVVARTVLDVMNAVPGDEVASGLVTLSPGAAARPLDRPNPLLTPEARSSEAAFSIALKSLQCASHHASPDRAL